VSIKTPANFYDEGLVLTNADRILAGEVPYRDFWTLYAPGYFYVVAALFKLVAANILVARLLDTAIRFLVTIEVYLIARRMSSTWVALIPYALVTLWLSAIRFYSYPAFPATGAILLSLLTFSRYLEVGRRRWLALTGLGLGLTAILRLDFGGYATVGIGVALAIHETRQATAGVRGQPAPAMPVGPGESGISIAALVSLIQAEALLALGLAVIALPLYGYWAAASGLQTIWTDLIVFPATTFRATRYLPVPPLLPDVGGFSGENWEDWARLYVPLAVYAMAIVVAAVGLFRKPRESGVSNLSVPLIALSIAGLGLVVKATSRYHELHALPTAILAAVTAIALFYRIPDRLWRNTLFVLVFAVFVVAAIPGPYILHFADLYKNVEKYPPTDCFARVERAGCVPLNQDQERAIEYIRSHTAPGEYVFVGNTRHDLSFANDLIFYFVADRRSPTRYTELHPGLATTLEVQKAIAADLVAKDVRWVVTFKMWESREPNASAVSSGVTYLDEFIQANYVNVTTIGNYRILQKKTS
jgi:hypothetical protein